jgi:hypothetical protein
MQAWALGASARGQTPPGRRIKRLRDLHGGSGNGRLALPGAEMMIGGNAKHVALTRAAGYVHPSILPARSIKAKFVISS